MIKEWARPAERLAAQLRERTATRLARSRLLRGSVGLFIVAGLGGLGVVAAYGITRGENANTSYTIMTRTDEYLIETVVNGTTTTRLVRVRVPVRRIVTEGGRTHTLAGGTQVVLRDRTLVQVDTQRVTVTEPVLVTVRDTVTVNDTVTVIDTVVITDVVTVTETVTETIQGGSG